MGQARPVEKMDRDLTGLAIARSDTTHPIRGVRICFCNLK
jgi:hypothetical protein